MSYKGREIRRAAGVLLLALVIPACLRADTIFSNFGPGYTDSGSAVSVAGSDAGGEYYAVAFTPSSDEVFTDAITDLLWFSGQDTVGAFLLADDAGVPGAIRRSCAFRKASTALRGSRASTHGDRGRQQTAPTGARFQAGA